MSTTVGMYLYLYVIRVLSWILSLEGGKLSGGMPPKKVKDKFDSDAILRDKIKFLELYFHFSQKYFMLVFMIVVNTTYTPLKTFYCINLNTSTYEKWEHNLYH